MKRPKKRNSSWRVRPLITSGWRFESSGASTFFVTFAHECSRSDQGYYWPIIGPGSTTADDGKWLAMRRQVERAWPRLGIPPHGAVAFPEARRELPVRLGSETGNASAPLGNSVEIERLRKRTKYAQSIHLSICRWPRQSCALGGLARLDCQKPTRSLCRRAAISWRNKSYRALSAAAPSPKLGEASWLCQRSVERDSNKS